MTVQLLFEDKSIKAKAKASTLGTWLLEDSLGVDELLVYAEAANPVNKATCMEALEWATKKEPAIANENLWNKATTFLQESEPRVKWESAKIIGNIAPLFPLELNTTIKHLLVNATHTGTVVRWATAYAIGEILKLNTMHNKKLLPQAEILCEKEMDNGVKKKYSEAIKKLSKKK